MLDAARTLLPELRERVRRIERSPAIAHGVLPFGVAAIDRALPGGGLARGAAPAPPLLPPAFSDGSRGWCCGACRASTFTGRALRRTGSIPGGSCWSGARGEPGRCGRLG